MKKALFILLVGLSVSLHAYAAKITGTVPVTPPLQPSPEGAKPNLSGSIDYGEKFAEPKQQKNSAEKEPEQNQAINSVETEQPSAKNGWILFFSLGSACLIAASWWHYRRDSRKTAEKK